MKTVTVEVQPDPIRDAKDYLAQLIRERACGSQIARAKRHLRQLESERG